MLSLEGINSESNVAKRIRISAKVYYTRLKQLIDADLIDKHSGKYVHTALGAIIYENYITSLGEQLDNLNT